MDTKHMICPKCRGDVTRNENNIICDSCKTDYEIKNNTPIMLSDKIEIIKRIDGLDDFKTKHKSVSNFYQKLKAPSPVISIHSKRNLLCIKEQLNKDAKILFIGGGIEKYGKYIEFLGDDLLKNSVNLEIEPGPVVNVVGDGHNLPFKKNVFDAVIIQGVLEHTRDSERVVSETKRVLKENGLVYAEIPFIQGYHSSPNDYRRYTVQGIDELFSDFKKTDSGALMGPASSFCWVSREFIATLLSFNRRKLYVFWSFLFGWILQPIKYLDKLITRFDTSNIVASCVYFIGKSK